MPQSHPEAIVSFWLGPALVSPDHAVARKEWWYRGGAAADEAIRAQFADDVELACQGGLQDWLETPEGVFALVLLLDQFTRNLFRGTPAAWRGDPRSFDVMRHAMATGLDKSLHPVERIWLYHPYHHSEVLAEQNEGIAVLEQVLQDAAPEWRPYVQQAIDGWGKHRDIVAQFGRFPHRNAILGRQSTPAEQTYLAAGAENFGQALRADSTEAKPAAR